MVFFNQPPGPTDGLWVGVDDKFLALGRRLEAAISPGIGMIRDFQRLENFWVKIPLRAAMILLRKN